MYSIIDKKENQTIKIGNRLIGNNHPAYIIAEIGINHNGDFSLAKQMILEAKKCGVDCVKFQKRHLESIYNKDVLDNPHLHSIGLGVYIPILKSTEFTIEQHLELKEYCKTIGIDYLCTPMDIKSALELKTIEPDAYKIASVNFRNLDLLEQVIKFEKPIILSTGMCKWEDIVRTYNYLVSDKSLDFCLLHCVSTYPVDFKDCNLAMISKLNELHSPVGYSGHERGVEISLCAVALGASIIERHFTLDRTMAGPDHAASIEPIGFQKLVEHIRAFELARGDGVKKITRGEQIVKESLGGNPIEV
jgi:N-acetylneuraminate synthase